MSRIGQILGEALNMLGLDEPIALGPFRVDLATTRLLRDGVELDLRPQAFRALKVLIQNPGRLVDYQQMIRDAWDGVHVSKHTVAVTIGEIKHILGEYGTWIYCQPRFGYRLEIPQSEILIRRGWHYWNQYNRLGYENALRCFQKAEEEDGADFRALEGISSTYLMLASFVMQAPRDIARPFWDYHARAVAASGETWELRLDGAYGRFVFDHELPEAERELVELQRERPNSAHVYIRLAMVYMAGGRLEEARLLLPPALAADALLPPLAFIGALLRIYGREFGAAVEWAENNLDLHPSSQVGRAHYAEALEFAGRTEEALAQYEMASARSDNPLMLSIQARFLAKIGRTAEASAMLEDLLRIRSLHYVDAYHIALLLDALGRRDDAFEELERAYDEKSYTLLFSKVDPKADVLRSDARFVRLRNRLFPPSASSATAAASTAE
jgi:DNA-binding winged helix-turn-helix (wHTH) protein/tetratricopeptide (TPR) repeat protein